MPLSSPSLTLSKTDQASLQTFVHRGRTNARTLTRAHLLLKLAEGWTKAEVCAAFDVCRNTVVRVRQRYLDGELEAVLQDKRQQHYRQALTGTQAAHLIAIACSPVSDGHDHWTLRMLAGKAIELGFVSGISHETIRQLLKKNDLKPWQHEHWCIPTVGAEFVAEMEDVLEEYAAEDTPEHPLVCFDEKPAVLHTETRPGLPVAPGRPARSDYEYERQGTANLFVMVEPLAGWRHIAVTERRTKQDYARCLQWLVDVAYPQAGLIRLVQDNLNTHQPSALYETFPPEEARRILRKLEFHSTPKHGSWLNMAEIEISIIELGCLSRPVGDVPTLCRRVEALETERNAAHCTIRWQFTNAQAREKLHGLYPKVPI